MLKLLNNFPTNSDNFTIILNFIEGQGQPKKQHQQQQPSLIMLSGVGYMDQITP
jgi:hypothetical protein